MSCNPNLTSSSDCSTEIITDPDTKQQSKNNILENSFMIKTEDKEIILSSKIAFQDSEDIIYASTWNIMWFELLEKLTKIWTVYFQVKWLQNQ